MTWSLMEDDSFKWPKELDPGTYKGVEPKGSLKDLFKKLDDAEKSFKGIDFPYAWVTSNPVTHLNWQNHAIKFLGGAAKSLSSDLGAIKSAADKAKDDKAVSGKAKDAAVSIGKAAKEHLKYVQGSELQTQVDRINKLCGTAAAEEVKKKTGTVKKSCKALTAARHPQLTAGGNELKKAGQKNADVDLEAVRSVLAEGCAAIVELIEEATRVRKSKGMMITGLSESEYNTLTRVRNALKPYAAGGAGWTKKFDIPTMRAGLASMKKNADFFDQVVRKMTSK